MKPQTVAVAGATGVVGQHVVRELKSTGVEVRSLSRALGVDLLDRAQVIEAIGGVDVIIDVSNIVTTRRRASVEFFERATNNLLAAAAASSVRRVVALSIVGIDEVDYGYYEGKRVQERLLTQSGLSVSILRATQFFEFAQQMMDRMSWGPMTAVPRITCAPVAAEEVGSRLAALATGDAGGAARIEMAGKEILSLREMTERLCRAQGRRRLLVPLPVPGAAGRLMATDGLLPKGEHETGRQTFDGWLAEHY